MWTSVSPWLQAIKDHEFCHVLDSPGSADLSAYVDFGAMRQVIADREDTGGGGGGRAGFWQILPASSSNAF